jgi:hypothetical protein
MKPKYFQKKSKRVGDKTLIHFRCGETVLCQPPYYEGQVDYNWVNIKGVDRYDKEQSEKAIGIKLLPL